MADAVEPVGQDMDQKAADEFVGIERHQLVASGALGAVILPFESHALAVKGDEPTVGNGDPVSVAGQIGEHRAGSAKRRLGVDHPFGLSHGGEACVEGCRLGQRGLVGEELQSPGLVGGVQPFEEQATEEPGEDRNGEEKAEPAGDPALAIGRDAASRDDDVGMRMVGE